MSDLSDPSERIRRVKLPSGRSIDVVYFDRGETTAAPPATDLHVCSGCRGRFVYPVRWMEHDAVSWEVELRCPSCERRTVGTYAQAAVDRFDEVLDRGSDALARDLRRLTVANMEQELECISRALAADALLPEDF